MLARVSWLAYHMLSAQQRIIIIIYIVSMLVYTLGFSQDRSRAVTFTEACVCSIPQLVGYKSARVSLKTGLPTSQYQKPGVNNINIHLILHSCADLQNVYNARGSVVHGHYLCVGMANFKMAAPINVLAFSR